MEACQAVEKEIDRVFNKFTNLRDHNEKSLGDLIAHIDGIRKELAEGGAEYELSATQSLILSQCVRKTRDTINCMSSQHKDLHASVSKVGKAIDRNFVSEFTGVTMDGAFEGEGKHKLINEVISDHFLRDGVMDVLQSLSEEASLELTDERRQPFLELHTILESLRNRDLQPALSWAEQNSHQQLQFRLHRLHFIDMLKEGSARQAEALTYAKKFAPYASQNASDIETLMGSLMYLRCGIAHSPYSHLLSDTYWHEICDMFTRVACSVMGLPVESKLSVTSRAGCMALPPLLNIQQVMQQRQCSNVWSAKDELPIEVDLGKEYRFHSIFACPILRNQCTESNPPVRLRCGHVISRDALNKLSHGNKVKCPYCPQEQNPAEARLVYF